MSSLSPAVFMYPNPTSISPYMPVYNDSLNTYGNAAGSYATYNLQQFSGYGTTTFNVGSALPVNSSTIDSFNTPLQFTGLTQFPQIVNFLYNRQIPMPQGLPYNLYVQDAYGRGYQVGSQQYNLIAGPVRYA